CPPRHPCGALLPQPAPPHQHQVRWRGAVRGAPKGRLFFLSARYYQVEIIALRHEGREQHNPSAVGVFPAQAAVVEHDISTIDVIAKSPPAKSKAVLALSLSDTFQFSDAMLTTPVVRVGAEKSQRIGIGGGQLRVASGEGAQESIKARSGADRKR